jgi:hypothetical protein
MLYQNLNDLEVRKKYQIEITNRFAALENLSDDEVINRAWGSIKENIETKARLLSFNPWKTEMSHPRPNVATFQ